MIRFVKIMLVVFSIVTTFLIVSEKFYSNKDTYVVRKDAGDPVADVVLSISHKGKIVVTDANIEATGSAYIPGMLWDSNMTSITEARIQVFLDLGGFKKTWIKQSGKNINITIPLSDIKYEIIKTNTKDTSNLDDWNFMFGDSYKRKLIYNTHKQIDEKLQKEASFAVIYSEPSITYQILQLFDIALSDKGYNIDVSIDPSK